MTVKNPPLCYFQKSKLRRLFPKGTRISPNALAKLDDYLYGRANRIIAYALTLAQASDRSTLSADDISLAEKGIQ